MVLTCSTMTSGLVIALSATLCGMVVVVVQDGKGDTVVKMADVVVLVTRSTTLSTASLIKALSPAVMLTAGLAVTVLFSTPTELTGAKMLLVPRPLKMEDGWNPSAKTSGSHSILKRAITYNNLEGRGVEGQKNITKLEDFFVVLWRILCFTFDFISSSCSDTVYYTLIYSYTHVQD